MTKRETILEATLQLVLTGGFYQLSIKKVAAAAHVAVGTIYVYFSSKEQLIDELYLSVGQRYHAALIRRNAAREDLPAAIRLMAHDSLQFFMDQPACFSLLCQYRYLSFAREKHSPRQMLQAPWVTVIEQAKDRSLLKEHAVVALIALLIGPLIEVAGRMDSYSCKKQGLENHSSGHAGTASPAEEPLLKGAKRQSGSARKRTKKDWSLDQSFFVRFRA